MPVYRFDKCLLDTTARTLEFADNAVAVEPRVFDLLQTLIEHPGSAVTKDELIERVWKGRIVSDSAINFCVSSARKAIGDSGRAQALIKTLPKVGYKLAIDVTEQSVNRAERSTASGNNGEGDTSRSYTDGLPKVAVVPAKAESAKQNDFNNGFYFDIISELSRFKSLRVLSFQTSLNPQFYSLAPTKINQVFEVDYLIALSALQQESRFICRVFVVDTIHDEIVWTTTFNEPLDGLHDVRQDMIARITGNVFTHISANEPGRCSRISHSTDAYRYLINGLSIYKFGEDGVENSRHASQWFQRSLEADPKCARSIAWLQCSSTDLNPNPLPAEFVDSAICRIQDALKLSPNDHEVHRVAGGLYSVVLERAKSEFHLNRSIELNPNDAHVLVRYAFFQSFHSQIASNMACIERAFELNPLRPDYFYFNRAVVHFSDGNYSAALTDLDIVPITGEVQYIYKIACQQALGKTKSARATRLQMKASGYSPTIESLKPQYPYCCDSSGRVTDRLFDYCIAAGMS